MAKYQPGLIIITCEASVSGNKMQEMVKNFGLKFKNCCVQADLYFVQVPEGKEEFWVDVFGRQDGVRDVIRIPDFSR